MTFFVGRVEHSETPQDRTNQCIGFRALTRPAICYTNSKMNSLLNWNVRGAMNCATTNGQFVNGYAIL